MPTGSKLSAALIVVRRSQHLVTMLTVAQEIPGKESLEAPIAGAAIKAFAALAVNAAASFISRRARNACAQDRKLRMEPLHLPIRANALLQRVVLLAGIGVE
jgi:hypothetical protein